MKRASTILLSSFVLFFAGIANAQSAPASEAPPLPPPLPAASAPSSTTGAAPAPAPSTPPVLPGPAGETAPNASASASPAQGETAPAAPPGYAQDDTFPATAPEPERAPTKNEPHAGFAMTMSIGYSIPAGSTTSAPNADLSNLLSGQVPLGIEVGGNVTPSLFIGLYGQYAFGGVGGTTDANCTKEQVNCSAHTFRGGLAIRYRFAPGSSVRPWLGYAVGYEVSTVSITSDYVADTASIDFSGWELGHFSAGVDMMTGEDHVAVGPYFDLGLGKYTHAHEEATGAIPQDVDIDNTALHEWITIGVRASFMP